MDDRRCSKAYLPMSKSDHSSDAKPIQTEDSGQMGWTKSPWLKLGIALVVEISVVVIVFFTPVRGWLGLDNARTIMHNFQTWRENLGLLAPLAYMLTYVVATVFAIPGSALTLASGAIFGAIQGTLWTVIGATLGATGAFLASRFFIGGTIAKRFDQGDRLSQLAQGLKENGFWFALSIRLAPIFPFNAVNYLFGLTPIRLSSYFFATFIGIIPGTLAYSWLGQEGAGALTGDARWQLFAALFALAALSAIPLLLKRFQRST
jgi:uncharacterized membrane protein YdjX (TVP38/TMEM64 family)